MQASIQPKTNLVNVACTCGNTFAILTTITKSKIHVELCSNCHPAYTGKRKIAAAGAIEKFDKKFQKYQGVFGNVGKDKD